MYGQAREEKILKQVQADDSHVRIVCISKDKTGTVLNGNDYTSSTS